MHWVGIVALALEIAAASGCTQEPVATPPAPPPCDRLADNLRRVATADDWMTTARGLAVPVVGEQVRVIVELESATTPTPEWPGAVEGRYQQFVQMLAPPRELCAIAATAGVLHVEAPAVPAPNQGPVR